MNIIFLLIFSAWWGFLRRWFGGLFPDEQYKVLGNRSLQTSIMMISMFPAILLQILKQENCILTKWLAYLPEQYYVTGVIIATLLLVSWLQFQFWSRGHGATFGDMGRTLVPDESRYDRWFKMPIDFCWNITLKLKNNTCIGAWLLQRWSGRMYGYTYDMIYHTARYTLCMLVPCILLNNISFVIVGLLAAPIYELNLRLYEKYTFKWMSLPWLNRANKLSEIVYGFIFGLGICL